MRGGGGGERGVGMGWGEEGKGEEGKGEEGWG